MNVQVTKDNVTILSKDNIHEGEYRINELSFDFSEEYTSDLVINAVFTNELGNAYQVSVIDGKCHIPAEILADTGQVVLGVYAYQINGEELELRYSPFPTSFVVLSGSYDPTAEESQEITPTQYEQYMQALQNGLNQVQESIKELNQATNNANDLVDEINQKLENGEFIGPQGPQGIQGEPGKDGTNGIDGVGITTITSGQATEENGNTITPITVEKTDGSSETFNVSAKNGIDGKNGQNGKDGINGTNGIDGQDGVTPNIQIGTVETLEPTEQASVTRTGTDEEPLLNFGIPKGEKGDTGEVTEDTLDNVIPKQTATDSIINVNDALKYKNFDFKVDGAYEQTTSDGSNLLDIDYSTNPILGERGDIQASLNDDYSFTVTGNKTDAEYSNIYFDLLTDINIKAGTQYYSHDIFLVLLNSELQFVKNMSEDFIADADYIVKRVYYTSNKQGDINEVIHPYLGTVPYDESKYYKYTGGNPSPNPDYPQEITTLTFDVITRRGKNLSDYQETNYQIDLQGNELVALPNGVKDELTIDKEGNVSLVKKVGKILLNSVEKWNLIGDTENYWEYANYNLSDSAKYSYCLSNYFSSDEDNRLIYTLTEIYCRFSKSLGIDVSDSEKFKTWLTKNDVYGYYEKTTPQTISLGKLSDLITTEQGSNTFAINGNIDTNISTTYALDLKKYIDNKISTVSQAVIEQE